MSGIRKRNKKKEKKQAVANDSSSSKTPSAPKQKSPLEEETLWQTFTSHPLIQILPIFLIPYTIYQGYYFLRLARPDLVSTATLGLVKLRPALALGDERQLLVVGSMSSGTVQVAADLHNTLQLEVGHEASDAQNFFVRDGTVSWFHIIRFLPPPESTEVAVKGWTRLCTNFTDNMGFHPRMYKPSSCSNYEGKWSRCWAHQCLRTLQSEWSCAWEGTCETPFQTTLHQVRNPLRTIESLVAKFCRGGLNGTIHPSFTMFSSVLFPGSDLKEASCIEAAASYVVDYNLALIEAREKGLVSDMYQIEETSPCDVARMAGLLEKEKVLYAPHYERIVRLCDIVFASDASNRAQQVMISTKHKINVGLVGLDWDDLQGGKHGSQRPEGDTALVDRVRNLMVSLGYDPNEASENDSAEFS